MNGIINYFLESLIIGAVIFLLFKAIFQKVENYSFQRIILIVSFVFVSIFPLINISISNPAINDFVIDSAYIFSDGTLISEEPRQEFLYAELPLIFYLIISLLFLLKIVLQFFNIAVYIRKGELFEQSSGNIIYALKGIPSPFSFWKWIFIPESYSYMERNMAIRHELSHTKRGHTLDLILSSIILSFQWFNPFLHYLKNNLGEIHEFQADMDVLKSGTDVIAYKDLLFSSQIGDIPEISNSLHKSLTFKRFIKMENLKQSKVRIRIVALFMVSAFLLFSVTSFSKKDVQSNEDIITVPVVVTSSVELPQEKPVTIPFTVVEVKPKFNGGDENLFTKWVASQLVYPEKAKKDRVQGRVILQFTVSETGKVEDVKIVRGVLEELDKEAYRVVASSPDWEPGFQKGKPVSVRYTFPVIFMLKK